MDGCRTHTRHRIARHLTRACRRALPAFVLLAMSLMPALATGAMVPSPQLRASSAGGDGLATWDALEAAAAHNSRRDEYLVVWSQSSSGPDELEIYGRVADRMGRWVGAPTRLSQMGPDGDFAFDAGTPDVAYDSATDQYLVVWRGDDAYNNKFEVYGQRVSAAGAEVGTDIRLSRMGDNADLSRNAGEPAVAFNAVSGEFLVVWSADDDTGGLVDDEFEIFAQRVTAAGAEIGTDDLRISDMGPDGNAAFDAVAPDVAVNAAGTSTVVWEGDDNVSPLVDDEREIFLQQLTSAGAETGTNDVRISDMGTNGSALYVATQPAIAYNTSANEFLAVWAGDDNILGLANDEREVFSQRLSAAGAQVGTNDGRVSDMGPNTSTAYGAWDPAVAYSPAADQYLVTWQGDDNTGTLVDDEFETFAQPLTTTAAETGGNDVRISRMGPDSGAGQTGSAAFAPAVAGATSTRRWLLAWHGDDVNGTLVDGEYEVQTSLFGVDPAIDLATGGNVHLRIDGAAAGDEAGHTVTDAGDVNGDGLGDLLVGAPSTTAGGANRAYVVWGTAGATTVDLNALGTAGFVITGLPAGQRTGFAAVRMDDLNGDGKSDFAIGTDDDRNGRTDSGSAYVIFGKATTSSVDVTALGSGGYRIDGPEASGFASRALASGDVNADGRRDLIIGADRVDGAGRVDAGAVYVVFGKSGTATIDLASLSGADGRRISGALAGDRAGGAVAAGDVNGDGTADVVLGAGSADRNGRTDSGSAWVVFGGPAVGDIDLASPGSSGFRIDGGAAGDGLMPVAAVSDLNGDGRDEVLAGAPGADPSGRAGAGAAAVVFGSTSTTTVDLAAPGSRGATISGAAAGDAFGSAVAAARDVDGDRNGDLIIGAPGAGNGGRAGSGSAFLVFGASAVSGLDAAGLGTSGIRLDGAAAADALGGGLGTSSDLTGDTRPELLAGARLADPSSRSAAGRAYVVSSALLMPGAATTAATAVTPSGATLNGTVSPRGQATRYWFEYGPTAAYGSSTTPASAGSGSTSVAVAVAVTGLAGDATYHHRLVTENADGFRTYGANATVTTDATPPSTPNANGGSLSWTSAASVTITGSGATDALTGIASYQYRTSTDGGSSWSAPSSGSSVGITATGETSVQFRAFDGAGNASAWGPAAGTAAGTVRIDRTAPSAPTVSGGSLSWQSLASVTLTGSGSTDAQSGVSGYEYRTSTNAGVTWGVGVAGASMAVTAEGTTLVQFRALDAAGNGSAWTPVSAGAGNTVRLDRTVPTVPSATGGSAAWQDEPSITLTRTTSTDAGAGVTGYEYRTSTDGGATWTAPVSGTALTVTAKGETLIQFRAIDGVGNPSGWGPAHTPIPDVGATARLGDQFGVDLSNAFNVRLRVDGAAAGDQIGLGALVPAGDVNGDGIEDVLIGVRNADPAGRTNAGAAYVVFGRATNGTVDLGSLGTGGYLIRGGAAGDLAGWSVANAGDVNGDGTPDALIGAPGADPASRTDAGAGYVVFGTSSTATVDLGTLGPAGYVIQGAVAGDAAGSAVTGLGDLNADGRADVALGAPRADPSGRSGAGSAIVAYGKVSTTPTDLATDAGPTVNGAAAGDEAGTAVADAGDIDGDGRRDLIVGVPLADGPAGTDAGAAFAMFTPASGNVDLAAPGSAGILVRGAGAGDQLGAAVAGPGDVNADGRPDMLVGAPFADPLGRADAGAAYVVFGSAGAATVDTGSLGASGYRMAGATADGRTGAAVGRAGDANADGRAEVLVSGPNEGFHSRVGAGTAWRVFGRVSGDVDLRAMTAAGGLRLDGFEAGDGAAPATGLTDLNSDGAPEILAGGPSADRNGRADSGSVFVVIPDDSPSTPIVTGGTLTWRSLASAAVSARGSTATAAASPVSYEYRTSTDGGSTWGSAASGATATITAEYETLVQFRSVDGAGRRSSWVPEHPSGSPAAAATVRLDRTLPTVPTVTGGSQAWLQSPASASIGAAGSTDAGGSLLTGYQYRTSTNGGTTWGTQVSGGTVAVSAAGETLVQLRSVDGAGNVSAWEPTHPAGAPTPAAVVRITSQASADLVTAGNIRILIEGAAAGDGAAGLVVVPAGDVNGDGLPDIAVGAPRADAPGGADAGSVYVVFGRADAATVDLASLGSAGTRIDGAIAGDAAGTALSALGDVNGDGRADLLVGAPGADPAGASGAGSAYVVFGTAAAGTIDLASLGSAGFRIDGAAGGDALGSAVAAPGDVNADGRPDVLAGAPDADRNGRTASGSAYVVHSPVGGTTVSTASLGAQGYVIDGAAAGDRLGTSVAAGGDVDGAGLADMVLGAPGADPSSRADAGAAAVVFGLAGSANVDMASPGARGRVISGATAGDALGTRVAIAGDQNASGPQDIAVSAPGADANGRTDAGTVFVVWGATGTTAVDTAALGAGGYRIDGATPGDRLGESALAAIPDIDGDGDPEVATGSGTIGMRGRAASGAGYWVLGAGTTTAVDLRAHGSRALRLDGAAAGDGLGGSAATVGDLNEDGRPELLVAAPGADPQSRGGAGAAYVVSPTVLMPSAETLPVLVAQNGSAGLRGSVNANGSATTYAFQYGPTSAFGTTGASSSAGSASADLGVSITTGLFLPTGATHHARLVATNAAGYVTYGAGTTFTPLDVIAPTDPTVSGGSISWVDRTSSTVTASGSTDAGNSGLAGYEYRTSTDGGVSWTTPASGPSVTLTAEGEALVQFRARDVDGNLSQWSPASPTGDSTVRLDRTPPTDPTVAGGSAAWQGAASVAVGASGGTDSASGVAGYEYRVSSDGGATWTQEQAGPSVTVTLEGETLVQFRTVDGVGRSSAWIPASPAPGSQVRLDRTAPTTPTVTGGGAGWQSVPSLTITAADSTDALAGLDRYEVRVSTDGGVSWSAPATGASHTVTDEGTTDVQFRALDTVGNATAWGPAVGGDGRARIDRTPPAAPTGLAATSPTPLPALSWTSVSDAASYVVTRNGVQVGTPAGPSWTDSTAPADGTHTYRVITVDAAGNQSTPSAGLDVEVDATPAAAPSMAAGSQGSLDWVNTPSLTIAVDPVPGATIEHRTSTDGGTTWSTPAAGDTITITDEGETLVQFRSVDPAGNTSAWTPSAAGGPVADATARIDRTPPPPPPASGGSLTPTTVASVTITATPAPGTTVQVRTSTDGGATWSAPASGASIAVSAPGETLVQFRALDLAGNAGAWGPAHTPPDADATVRIDRSAPPAPLITAVPDPAVPLSSGAGRVDLTTTLSGDGASVVITEAGRVVHDGTAGTRSDPGLADNTTYTYEAVARDSAGNLSSIATVEVTTPDRTAPAQPAAPNGSGYPLSLSWTAVPDASSYELSRDGTAAGSVPGISAEDTVAVDAAAPPIPTGVSVAATGPGRAAVDWAAVTDNGTPYAFTVRAVDAEGNASAYSPASTLTARSGTARYRVLVDGTQVAETTTLTVDLDGLTGDAPHSITVIALDRAGNASAPSAPVVVTVAPDLAPAPRLRLHSDRSHVRPGDVVRFTATVEGTAVGEVNWRFGNGATATGTAVETTYAAAGRYLVTATVAGEGGGISQASLVVVVDGTPPNLDLTQSGTLAMVQASDDDSGLERIEWIPGPGRQATTIPATGIPLTEGPNLITLRAIDRAGNVREITRTLIADRVAPTLSVRVPALALGTSAPATITAADTGTGLAAIEYAGKRFPAKTTRLVLPAGRRVTVTAIDTAGNRSNATFTVRRVANAKRPTTLVWKAGEPKLKGDQKVLYTTTWAQLQVLGRLPKKAKPNGRYTKKMVAAVTKYQKKAKLKATGVVDTKTRARLAKDTAKKTVVITGR